MNANCIHVQNHQNEAYKLKIAKLIYVKVTQLKVLFIISWLLYA